MLRSVFAAQRDSTDQVLTRLAADPHTVTKIVDIKVEEIMHRFSAQEMNQISAFEFCDDWLGQYVVRVPYHVESISGFRLAVNAIVRVSREGISVCRNGDSSDLYCRCAWTAVEDIQQHHAHGRADPDIIATRILQQWPNATTVSFISRTGVLRLIALHGEIAASALLKAVQVCASVQINSQPAAARTDIEIGPGVNAKPSLKRTDSAFYSRPYDDEKEKIRLMRAEALALREDIRPRMSHSPMYRSHTPNSTSTGVDDDEVSRRRRLAASRRNPSTPTSLADHHQLLREGQPSSELADAAALQRKMVQQRSKIQEADALVERIKRQFEDDSVLRDDGFLSPDSPPRGSSEAAAQYRRIFDPTDLLVRLDEVDRRASIAQSKVQRSWSEQHQGIRHNGDIETAPMGVTDGRGLNPVTVQQLVSPTVISSEMRPESTPVSTVVPPSEQQPSTLETGTATVRPPDNLRTVEDWVELWDAKKQKVYYFNKRSKTTTWNRAETPFEGRALGDAATPTDTAQITVVPTVVHTGDPDRQTVDKTIARVEDHKKQRNSQRTQGSWTEIWDDKKQKYYYYNAFTKKTTWNKDETAFAALDADNGRAEPSVATSSVKPMSEVPPQQQLDPIAPVSNAISHDPPTKTNETPATVSSSGAAPPTATAEVVSNSTAAPQQPSSQPKDTTKKIDEVKPPPASPKPLAVVQRDRAPQDVVSTEEQSRESPAVESAAKQETTPSTAEDPTPTKGLTAVQADAVVQDEHPTQQKDGWVKKYSEEHRRWFYKNLTTKKTQWKAAGTPFEGTDAADATAANSPRASVSEKTTNGTSSAGGNPTSPAPEVAPVVKDGWTKKWDERRQKWYYRNNATKEVQWSVEGTPFAEKLSLDALASREPVTIEGWRRLYNAQKGKFYYVNLQTKKSQYEAEGTPFASVAVPQ